MAEQGGVQWELSEAIRLMGEAVASGDAEQIATAMRRHAEALSNQALAVLVPTLEKTLKAVVKPGFDQVAAAIDSVKAHQDQRFDYVLRQLEGEFTTNAAWRDRFAQLYEQTAALVVTVEKRQQRFQRESRADRKRLHQEIGQLRDEFLAFRANVDAYMDGNKRAELDALAARVAGLEHTYTGIDRNA